MLLRKVLFNSIHNGLKTLHHRHQICKLFVAGYASLTTSVPYDILQQGLKRPNNQAIKDSSGCSLSYGELLNLSVGLKKRYVNDEDGDFSNTRIAFLTSNDISYIATKLSIWLCNSTVVPLSPKYPLQELEYVINQSSSTIIIAHPQFKQKAMELAAKTGVRPVILPDNLTSSAVEASENDINCVNTDSGIMSKSAMILYTSGTTGKPKGVLMNHLNLTAQVGKMLDEWEWNENDNILHVLPLHHTHGIVNALLCPLVSGAQITMEKSFDAKAVWDYFLNNPTSTNPLTLFMAVPTIYSKLIQYYDDNLQGEVDDNVKDKFQTLRLMVSGSAALPIPILEKWRSISGHFLLERYGMTEFGMGLTNPYKGERKPGCVGLPFPYTEVKIVGYNEDGSTDYDKTIVYGNHEKVESSADGFEGELLVRSPSVFQEYFNNPSATEETFHQDWFKTGDTCTYVDGSFRIVGRSSVDIIKSGGYKIGALEIEATMLEHPLIQEIAVLGVPDEEWGQVVAAIITPSEKHGDEMEEIIVKWCKERMPSYRIPRKFCFVSSIPRNAMGKVNKKQLLKEFF